MGKITIEGLKKTMIGNVVQYKGRIKVDQNLKKGTEPFVNNEGTLTITLDAFRELQEQANKNRKNQKKNQS
jgi:hypothetical protein